MGLVYSVTLKLPSNKAITAKQWSYTAKIAKLSSHVYAYVFEVLSTFWTNRYAHLKRDVGEQFSWQHYLFATIIFTSLFTQISNADNFVFEPFFSLELSVCFRRRNNLYQLKILKNTSNYYFAHGMYKKHCRPTCPSKLCLWLYNFMYSPS